MVGDDFLDLEALTNFTPESRYAADQLWAAFNDVVKRDEATTTYEGRVHLEVGADALIRVVAVDEEKVDGLPQKRRDAGVSRRRMRVAANQMDLLLFAGEGSKERSPCAWIRTAECSSVHIDRHECCIWGSDAREQEESSSVKRAELEDRLRRGCGEALEQRHHLFTDLPRTRSDGAVREAGHEIVGWLNLYRRVSKEATSTSRFQSVCHTAQQANSGEVHSRMNSGD
jgi:hypothetical protein